MYRAIITHRRFFGLICRGIGGIAFAGFVIVIHANADILWKSFGQRWNSLGNQSNVPEKTTRFSVRGNIIQMPSESVNNETNHHEGKISATGESAPVKTLFGVFKLMNLTLLQEMETDRNEFDFLLTPMKITWKVSSRHTFQHKKIRWSMVVAVKSDYKRKSQRNLVRKTWGAIQYIDGVRIEVMFVTGRPASQSDQFHLWKENIQFGDILEVDQNETYHGIGLKALASMQWVAENMPEEWMYFSADDDLYADIAVLIKDVDKLIENAKGNMSGVPIICAYSYEAANIPERGDTKWTISRDIYPHDLYPPFCLGGFYGMPVMLASAIYYTSRHYPYYRMDDVFITGFMRLKFCDVYSGDTFAYDKNDRNCAISTKRNSNFKHYYTPNRLEKLWMQQELSLFRKGVDITKRTHPTAPNGV